jgi:hypothetical protein
LDLRSHSDKLVIVKRGLIAATVSFLLAEAVFAQQDLLIDYAKRNRGNSLFRKFGIHNGNRIAITFRNDGSISGTNPNDIRGAWPYPATQDSYIGDVDPIVGIELPLRDYSGDGKIDTIHSSTITTGPRNGQSNKIDPTDGHFQGFEPIPGFVNQVQDTIAMSHIPTSWPAVWPDHPDWVDLVTGRSVWNGYFGKGVTSADQESYFVMDDQQDNSVQRRTRYLFYPDSTDTTRHGMGLVVRVRGLQWSQIQAQDVLFWLYEITNISTTDYSKVVFGEVVGGCVGDVGQVYVDCRDDLAFFDLNNNITYTWDSDDKTTDPQWIPLNQVLPGVRNNIGYAGYAYLESPGNGFDGIDNDNDATDPSSPAFEEKDFTFNSSLNAYVSTRTLHRTDPGTDPDWPANKIVLIDPKTYDRTVVALDTLLKSNTDTAYVYSLGVRYKIYDGVTLVEIPNNALDDNLNGLIDENHDLHYKRIFKDRNGVVLREDTRPIAYKNFIMNRGTTDVMIDERRDSGPGTLVTGWVPDYTQPRDPVTGKYHGINKVHWSGDENGDWDATYDDVGADGVPNTHDVGEGDRIPTEGEPHFDKTDVNESDQLGLTSFNFFNQTQSPDMSNSELLWNRMVPGYFDVIPRLPQDGDFIYSSGYFPLLSDKTERFSLALVFGEDSSAIFKNKQIVQQIYDANYNFTRPPDKPIVRALPGDKKVTLIWDSRAENFIDRSIRDTSKQRTFEGYRIYRSTDPGFTEGGGQPIASFDLKDQIRGYFIPKTQALAALPRFFLGDDIGLVHTFVDSSLQNGQGYYYAVTAYTKGDADNNVYPAETPKFVTVDNTGKPRLDVNTAYVIPQAPVAGYIRPDAPNLLLPAPGMTAFGTGSVYLNVIDSRSLLNKTYRVAFSDTTIGYLPNTTAYRVIDYTDVSSPRTLVEAPLRPGLEPGDFDRNVFDGMVVTVQNDWNVAITNLDSLWNKTYKQSNYLIDFEVFSFATVNEKGIKYPRDYNIAFDSALVGNSAPLTVFDQNSGFITIPATRTNFKVFDAQTGAGVPYTLLETVPSPVKPNGYFTANDLIILLQNVKTASGKDTTVITWTVSPLGVDSVNHVPTSGDTLRLRLSRPFSRNDIFQFSTKSAIVDAGLATSQLDAIRVVPNPYVVATSQEPPLPPTITSGRGERKISFIHLPKNSVVYIYTIRGELVRRLNMPADQNIDDGAVDWDLRTRENLDVAYGVYLYLVDAPAGRKMGKLAIIK